MRGVARCVLSAVLVWGAASMIPAAAAAAGAACSSQPSKSGEWPVYGHDAANTRTQPAEQALGPGAAGTLQPAWSFSSASVGDAGAFQSTPSVERGCLFIGSSNAVVYALGTGDGKLAWRRKLDLASAGFGGGIVGAPLVTGDRVIVLVNEANAPYLAALSRTTGALLWKSAPIAQGDGYYTNASPVLANGMVVAGYSPAEGDPAGSGGFALVEPASGAIIKVSPAIPPADQAQGYAGAACGARRPTTRRLATSTGARAIRSRRPSSTRTPTRS